MENIIITSEAFKNGENIPVEYTCDGKNVSPSLSWGEVPVKTKSIALIMDDPDAATTFVHWILFNIPARLKNLPKSIKGEGKLIDGSIHGLTGFGRVGYGGPCPPSGKHRYFFRLYALDTTMNLLPGSSRMQVDMAMTGHILGYGELMGAYRRQ